MGENSDQASRETTMNETVLYRFCEIELVKGIGNYAVSIFKPGYGYLIEVPYTVVGTREDAIKNAQEYIKSYYGEDEPVSDK